MEIITNNHSRPLITWDELTDSERSDFDWDGAEEDLFFRYRGTAYCLSDFLVAPFDLRERGWDGFSADTMFSGVAIKTNGDFDMDSVVCGLVLC